MKTIFIIGQHRTGSTLLKNMLNAHSEISMAYDEMSLYEPLRKNTLNKILESDLRTIEIVELIFNGKVYGGFWWYIHKSGLTKIDFLEILDKTRIPIEVLKEVLVLIHKKSKKLFCGVKYPLHHSKIDLLLKNFQDPKILLITRNPFEIISSKLHDNATKKRKDKSIFHWVAYHYITLLYFLIEYRQISKMLNKYKEHLYVVDYNYLTTEKEQEISMICNYLKLKTELTMLSATGKPSSFSNIKDSDFVVQKRKLSIMDKMIIQTFTYRSRKRFSNYVQKQ